MSELIFQVGDQVVTSDRKGSIGTIIEAAASGDIAGTRVAGPGGRYRVQWSTGIRTWYRGAALALSKEKVQELQRSIMFTQSDILTLVDLVTTEKLRAEGRGNSREAKRFAKIADKLTKR